PSDRCLLARLVEPGARREPWQHPAASTLELRSFAPPRGLDESHQMRRLGRLRRATTSHRRTVVMKPTRSMVDQSFGRLDEIVKGAMKQTGVPGISVAVVFDDQVLYQNGYGVRSTETTEPVRAETVFQIASLSKPVSATIMAELVGGGKWNHHERGRFAWEDPIIKYAPNVILSDPWVTRHVTFKDLFAHRSGLPGSAGNDLETIEYDREAILQRLRYVPIDGFRDKYDYSNFGLTLAGEVAAEAAGSNW